MARIARLVLLVAVGYGLARLLSAHDVAGSSLYLYATALLLAVGLYGSTAGIDVASARADARTIVLAVTVGVVCKAALIGGVLALALQDPLFLVLGVVVAQIDPLSVAAILGDARMSPRAKAILASWASFDDPLTVILAVYAAAVAAGTFHLGTVAGQGTGLGAGLEGYAVDLAANLAFAVVAYAVWRGVRGLSQAHLVLLVLPYLALALLFAAAVAWFLMLGLALAGLFFRPAGLDRHVGRVTSGALAVAAVLLGVLLVGGVDPVRGLLLGAAAFGAQVVVGWALTRHLPRDDRLHLMLAQQNGITAIILSLRLEAQFVGVVGVVAPAILVTNAIHEAANRLLDRGRAVSQPGTPPGSQGRPSGSIVA